MAKQYYVRIRGRVQGPFDLDKVRSLVRRGQVSRMHEVSEDAASWVKAADFGELFESSRSVTEISGSTATTGPQADELRLEGGSDGNVSANTAGSDGWHYAVGNSQQGPVAFTALQSLLRSGQLPPETDVWTAGMTDWKPASEVPGLVPTGTATRRTDATQAARVADGSISVASVIPSIRSMRMWALIIAIFGIIAFAVQLIRGLVVIAGNSGVLGLTLVAASVVQGVCFILLLTFALRAGKFLDNRQEASFVDALKAMRAFWVYNGVLLCVLLCLFLLVVSLVLAGADLMLFPGGW